MSAASRAPSAESSDTNLFSPTFRAKRGTKAFPDISRTLDLLGTMNRNTNKGYDEAIAYALSLASAWSYADPHTLHDVMNSIGFENRCYSISLSNDALSVHTSASLLQHVDGSAAILCFRGTEPTNIINWLTDASVAPERFHTWGAVHGGFYRSLMPMSRYIACRLTRAIRAPRAGRTGT
ncbi:hypothetical protein predicted by Glimmer/Critica [Sorangium cellulosum So ce56]|uniref:Uncharacterized protein n=2 Tax=Sorangium cellulosum TaxID=56 RepID=A9G3S9_SORC5|nr:hypothetical protein predicted by Glimmer/Critica [Sorangium cellulosum So ce56]